jgi:hypothetical protein
MNIKNIEIQMSEISNKLEECKKYRMEFADETINNCITLLNSLQKEVKFINTIEKEITDDYLISVLNEYCLQQIGKGTMSGRDGWTLGRHLGDEILPKSVDGLEFNIQILKGIVTEICAEL